MLNPTTMFRLFLAAVLGCLLVACGEVLEEPPPMPDPFAMQVGIWDAETATFNPLVDGQPVSVVQGFQGLVFLNLALFSDANIPPRFQAEGTLVFRDTGEVRELYDNQVLFETRSEGMVVPSFRVGLPYRVSELADRAVDVTLTLTSLDDAWQSDAAFWFIISDQTCRHLPDGTFECDD